MNNTLNLLVVEIELLNVIEKYHINSLISLSFENQELRDSYLERLHRFGVIKPIQEAIGEELYIKYFEDYIFDNNILFLDSYLENNIKCNISDNIKSLLGEESIVGIKEIQKQNIEYMVIER